jgi:hypothetical protein
MTRSRPTPAPDLVRRPVPASGRLQFYKILLRKKPDNLWRGPSIAHRAASPRPARALHEGAGAFFEIGPGHGTLGELAVADGWHYTAIEASPILMDVLKKKGLKVIEAWTPPMPMADASADVVYADQVLEHMRGIDDARQFTAEALAIAEARRMFFRRRAGLPERAAVLLGRRLHAQLRDDRAPHQAAVQRRRLRDSAHRARDRSRHRD